MVSGSNGGSALQVFGRHHLSLSQLSRPPANATEMPDWLDRIVSQTKKYDGPQLGSESWITTGLQWAF